MLHALATSSALWLAVQPPQHRGPAWWLPSDGGPWLTYPSHLPRDHSCLQGSQSLSSMPLSEENILLDCFLIKPLSLKHLFWPRVAIYSAEKGSPSNRWLWGLISQNRSFENQPEIHRKGVQWTSPKLFWLPLAEERVATETQPYFWKSLMRFPNIEEKYSHCLVTKYSENVNIFFGFYIVITDSLGKKAISFLTTTENIPDLIITFEFTAFTIYGDYWGIPVLRIK